MNPLMDILSIRVAKSVIIPRGRLDLDCSIIVVWGNAF